MPVQAMRARLARVVLASDTSAGRAYNLVVFEPAPGITGLV